MTRARLARAAAGLPLLLAGFLAASPAAGQAAAACSARGELALTDPSETRAVLARALAVGGASSERGSGIFRSAVRRAGVCADSARFALAWMAAPREALEAAPARAFAAGNSAYPRDRNNGVLWGGAGLNAQLEGGLQARYRWLDAALVPRVVYQSNAEFDAPAVFRPERSRFANPYHPNIDLPLRFGQDPFTVVDPGPSYLGAAVRGVEARFSHENLWLGAAQLNPILLSNTAGGFPHLRVGTARPVDVFIGYLEAHTFWGSVSESEYFDGNPDNDSHLFTGTAVVFEPRVLPGLHLGIARVYHDTLPALGHSPGFYLGLLGESPLYTGGGNRIGNGIGALFGRWVLPESGFEVYFEWARDDTPFNLEDVIREPDWTQAYTLGFQKVFLSPERLVRFYGELVHLGESTPVRGGRGHNTFYTHGRPAQGHTHRGQLLGAGLGLGADSRSLGVDVFDARSRTGLWLEHARYDEDTYYRTFAPRYGEARHNAELTAEVRRTQRFPAPGLEAELLLRVSRQYDRHFLPLPAGGPALRETNWGTELGLRWQPPGFF